MQFLDASCYIHDDNPHALGISLTLRTTILVFAPATTEEKSDLWIHSPTRLTPQLQQELAALGRVAYLVEASNGHHLYLQQWANAYPQAKIVVTAGILKKQPFLATEKHRVHVLTTQYAEQWAQDLVTIHVAGVPLLDEYVFFHKASRSLIVTDSIQNHSEAKAVHGGGFLVQKIMRWFGWRDLCLAPPLRWRLTVKDRQALIQSLDAIHTQILQHDCTRLIVAHGSIVQATHARDLQALLVQIRG